MVFKISQAACTGQAHREGGKPGQDMVACVRGEPVSCMALADGAGSKCYSGIGAEIAVVTVSRLMGEQFEALWAMADELLAGVVVDECAAQMAMTTLPLEEMGSTLLFFAAHRDGRYLAGHMGDGVMVRVDWPEGEPVLFSPPENGQYLNETFFLTMPCAEEHLRVYRGRLEGEGAVLLMSDGAGESLYQRQQRLPAPACATFARWLRDGEEQVISAALDKNLEQVLAQNSADDLSLSIMTWRPEDPGFNEK